jgi:hypothetical protein
MRPARDELVLRLVASAPVRTKGVSAGAALRSGTGLPLGDALVDTGTRSGVFATIYLDRVAMLAAAGSMDMRLLLGYAIAHEIGHLLIGSNAHSPTGLMRSMWKSGELKRYRTGDWMFTTEDIAAIRTRREGARVLARW